jgi:hypothetical protein
MGNLEDIFLSQIGTPISDDEEANLSESIDLLSTFEKYFGEDVGEMEGLNVLKSYNGILNLTPNQISTNVEKLAKGVVSSKGIARLREILKQIKNYKNVQDPADKMLIFLITMYLYGIEKNFNASSAGFLFENFIGGITSGDVVGGKGELEDVSIDGELWGVKFLKESSSITGSYGNYKKLVDAGKKIGLIFAKKKGNAIEFHIIQADAFMDEIQKKYDADFPKKTEEVTTEEEEKKAKTQFSITQSTFSNAEKIQVDTEELLVYFEKEVFTAAMNVMRLSSTVVDSVISYMGIFKNGKNTNQLKTLTNSIVDRSKELSSESKKLST